MKKSFKKKTLNKQNPYLNIQIMEKLSLSSIHVYDGIVFADHKR